jgi:hypothetical protein
MIQSRLLRAGVLACALSASACGRTPQTDTPIATATVTLGRADAAIGTPIEMAYRFVVAQDAPKIGEDDTVFVHFIDTDRELMWTDDHQPPVPTSQWKPGQTIQYTRTMFVPKFPYSGDTSIVIGIYSPKSGMRIPLSGQSRGQREYEVARFDLRPQADNLYVVFRDGWHPTEAAEEQTGVEWQWSKKTATLTFRNPMREALLYLQCDQPVQGLDEPQHVELRVGETVVDSFTLPPGDRELRKVSLSSAQMGTGETVDVTVSVDKTFVPATITQLKSIDARELGIRVFRAYVQPQ